VSSWMVIVLVMVDNSRLPSCPSVHAPARIISDSGSFECLDDDVESSKLAVRVANMESGVSAYEAATGVQEGDFQLEDLPADARYSLCFRNNYEEDDDENQIDVGFNLRFHAPPRSLEEGELGPDGERALKLVDKASKVHQAWDTLQDHFDFLRNREALHEEMNNEILLRLTRWTFVESFLVVAMAVVQVMYWKRFFETRRYL
jgi:hypothetical protein